MLSPPARQGLEDALLGARAQGFLGPGPVEAHIDHALGFAQAAGGAPDGPALDLGSGGGLPGLVLATAWPSSIWILLDAGLRRTTWLAEAVGALGLTSRVAVVRARAEEAAHEERWRAGFALVVARSFGPPAVVAECAAGFLATGGSLVVSEPPGTPARWPADGLAPLGLVPVADHLVPGFQRCCQERRCPDRYPRRVGIPAKRPLF